MDRGADAPQGVQGVLPPANSRPSYISYWSGKRRLEYHRLGTDNYTVWHGDGMFASVSRSTCIAYDLQEIYANHWTELDCEVDTSRHG